MDREQGTGKGRGEGDANSQVWEMRHKRVQESFRFRGVVSLVITQVDAETPKVRKG